MRLGVANMQQVLNDISDLLAIFGGMMVLIDIRDRH